MARGYKDDLPDGQSEIFFAKGLDGRIDDASAGWKGKGIFTTWGTRTPFHSETGKGTQPKVVHFQYRPNPLAH